VTAKDAADATDVDETETEKVTDEAVDDATETDDAATEAATQSDKRNGILRRSARVVAGRISAIVLAVALLASAGVAAWLYFDQYRPGQETNDAAANVALDAAKRARSRCCRTHQRAWTRTSQLRSRI
jgi:Mce-associated membrane protein